MKKPQPRDKINYLDEVQYESTLVPGVGNYNPRVILLLFRFAQRHKHQTVKCKKNLKSGVKFTIKKAKKSHKKLQT
jgi:hypothetical protein